MSWTSCPPPRRILTRLRKSRPIWNAFSKPFRKSSFRPDSPPFPPRPSRKPLKIWTNSKNSVTICKTSSKSRRFWNRGAPLTPQNIQLPEDSFLQVINQDKNNVYFIVVSRNSLADCNLPIATLPSCTDAKALADRRLKDDAQIDVLEKNFVKLAEQNAETWKKELERLQDEIALAKAECGMGESGILAYLNGYVPEKKLETLRKTAQTNGWALLVDDVKEDDTNVPTLLNIPKKFSMAQQIFDFIGILPGYFETDVSIALFIFLTLFCGILIGDAGYGLLMTAAILYGFKKATTPNAKEGLKLLLCISLSILAYGWLSGNCAVLRV